MTPMTIATRREVLTIPGPSNRPAAPLAALRRPPTPTHSCPIPRLSPPAPARLHAVRDGCLGRRRRDGRLAEGADDAAGPGRRRRQRTCARRPPEGRSPHALLGLDLPPRPGPLPEVRRDPARAPALRAPQGA